MEDLSQNKYYIDIHNSIKNVRNKILNYSLRKEELTEKESFHLVRLKKILNDYESNIEIWFGIYL